MTTIEPIVASVIKGIAAAYKGRTHIRGALSTMALEIGLLPEVRRMVCHFADKRKYPTRPMLSLHDDHPSVYLLGWREGDWTDVHDHGQCEVGIYVMQGVVTEDVFACTHGGNRNKCISLSLSRNLPQGSVATCPRNYVHAVGNIFPELAATLHCYGPELDDMNIYTTNGAVLEWKEHWHANHHRAQH